MVCESEVSGDEECDPERHRTDYLNGVKKYRLALQRLREEQLERQQGNMLATQRIRVKDIITTKRMKVVQEELLTIQEETIQSAVEHG